jgi:phenylacetate-coenzyme A ligase PaaK-like adenylate-forming protein
MITSCSQARITAKALPSSSGSSGTPTVLTRGPLDKDLVAGDQLEDLSMGFLASNIRAPA